MQEQTQLYLLKVIFTSAFQNMQLGHCMTKTNMTGLCPTLELAPLLICCDFYSMGHAIHTGHIMFGM